MIRLSEKKSIQIVRPMHAFEAVPDPLTMRTMLMPDICPVVFTKIPKAACKTRHREMASKSAAVRKLTSGAKRNKRLPDIMRLLSEGKYAKEISVLLGFSESTIRKDMDIENLRAK